MNERNGRNATMTIVRNAIPEHPRIKPGTIAFANCRSFPRKPSKLQLSVSFYLEAEPAVIYWAPAFSFLPYSKFLAFQPIHAYWYLADRVRAHNGDPDCYLTDPRTERFGKAPFRFESEGELRHYIALHDLNPDLFYAGHRQIASLTI